MDGPHEFSCVMLYLPNPIADEIRKFAREHISKDDLGEDGYEVDPHITLKYGLETKKFSDIEPLLPKSEIVVTLGPIEKFDKSEDYDVIYVSVPDADQLYEINAELSELPNKDEHPVYTPHVCLAYVKKGAADDLLGNSHFEGRKVKLDDLVWSEKDSEGRKHVSLKKQAQRKIMADNQAQPQKFLVNIPGVINTYTMAVSGPAALANSLYQAFETRDQFMWDGKKYEGEIGLKSLIDDVLNSPAYFDMVQQLPGMPSQPVSVELPTAAPAMAPTAFLDADQYIARAGENPRLKDVVAALTEDGVPGDIIDDVVLGITANLGKKLKKWDEEGDEISRLAHRHVLGNVAESGELPEILCLVCGDSIHKIAGKNAQPEINKKAETLPPFPKPGESTGRWGSVEDTDLDELWFLVLNDSDLYSGAVDYIAHLRYDPQRIIDDSHAMSVSKIPVVMQFLKAYYREICQKYPPEQSEYAKIKPSDSTPESPDEVLSMNPKDRQKKLDNLLDQYSAEDNPERRQQLEEQMRSLKASLLGWMRRDADVDKSAMVKLAYSVNVAGQTFEVIPVYGQDLIGLDHYEIRDELNRVVLEIPTSKPLSRAEIEQHIFASAR